MDQAPTNDNKQTRGRDAGDHPPEPSRGKGDKANGKQDAPNYKDRTDRGKALPIDDVSSANDE